MGIFPSKIPVEEPFVAVEIVHLTNRVPRIQHTEDRQDLV